MFAAVTTWRIGSSLLVVIGGLVAASGCTTSEADARAEELESLHQERLDLIERFGIIQSTIRKTQGAALDHPGVRIAQDSFYTQMKRFAQEEDPEVVELLERAARVGADFERMSSSVPIMTGEPVTAEQQRAVATELQTVERALRPHVQRALADSTVHSAFVTAQDSLVEQMTRLDPNVPETIRRMEEVAEQIRELDIRIAELRSGP
jgi:hypothetical protein